MAAVHQLHRGVVHPVGEEPVARALHRHAVALFLLAELGGGVQLALGEVLHHAVELVDLADMGGLEALQALYAALHAFHEPVHRARDPAQHDQQDGEAQPDAEGKAQIQVLVKLSAQAIDGIVRHEAAHHPIFVLEGNGVAVELKRGAHAVDGLVAERDALDALERAELGVEQGKRVPRARHRVVERAHARKAAVGAVLLAHGQRIARAQVGVEVAHGEVRAGEVGHGHLDAQDAVHRPVVHERHRVGDHLVVVEGAVLQDERRGPICEVGDIHVGVLLGQQVRRVEEGVRVALACAHEAERRVPRGVKADVGLSGEVLVAALKKQVGVACGAHRGVGVAQEEAVVARGLGGVGGAADHRVQAGCGGALQAVEQLGENLPDKGGLHVVGGHEVLNRGTALGQERLKGPVDVLGLSAHHAPLAHHGALEHDAAVVHGYLVEVDGVCLQLMPGVAGGQGREQQDPLDQDDDRQRHQQDLEQ